MTTQDPDRSLRAVNLNLLPILRELLRERNVTRAAQKLNMTQSAVSEALGRLRVQFRDELLVRVGRKMVPTRAAQALAPKLEDLLFDAEDLFKPRRFDPAEVEREFLIATGDTVALALGDELIRRLSEKAPRSSIQFLSIQYVTRRDLEEGKIDLLIIPRGVIPQSVFAEEGLEWSLVYHEDWVCIARKDHPEFRDGMSLEALDRSPSVACRLDESSYLYGAIPGRRGTEQLRVSQFTLLPLMVMQSDAVAMVQRHVANWFAKHFPIDVFELPIPFPELDVCAYWAPIHSNDPMHSWLRAEIADICATSQNPWFPNGEAEPPA